MAREESSERNRAIFWCPESDTQDNSLADRLLRHLQSPTVNVLVIDNSEEARDVWVA